jgi:hypothetical protein
MFLPFRNNPEATIRTSSNSDTIAVEVKREMARVRSIVILFVCKSSRAASCESLGAYYRFMEDATVADRGEIWGRRDSSLQLVFNLGGRLRPTCLLLSHFISENARRRRHSTLIESKYRLSRCYQSDSINVDNNC